MDLSIIIPSFNTKILLSNCLNSIINSLKTSKLKYEVLIIDNNSTDGTCEMVKKDYNKFKLISNKSNLGYGKANNLGIKLAKGEKILLLNSDTEILDNSIEKLFLVSKIKTNTFIGPMLINKDLTIQPSSGPEFNILNVFLMLFVKGDKIGLTRYKTNKSRYVDWVSGACVIGSKSDFIKCNLFDEKIFMYMEEIDFFYRVKKLGYKIYLDCNSKIIHLGSASSSDKKNPVIQIYTGLIYYYNKHYNNLSYILKKMLLIKAFLGYQIGKIKKDDLLTKTYEKAISLVR